MRVESHGGIILTGKTEEVGEKPVPVPLCAPQIPRGLTGAQTARCNLLSIPSDLDDFLSSHSFFTYSETFLR
jgi:hypothetical protein